MSFASTRFSKAALLTSAGIALNFVVNCEAAFPAEPMSQTKASNDASTTAGATKAGRSTSITSAATKAGRATSNAAKAITAKGGASIAASASRAKDTTSGSPSPKKVANATAVSVGAKILEDANQKLAAGEVRDALALYDKYVNANPNDPKGLSQRAEFNYNCGRVSQAAEDYSKLITVADRKNAATFFKRAKCYEKLGKNDLAAADFTRAIELVDAPLKPAYYETRSEFQFENKNFTAAFNDLDKAIDLSPGASTKAKLIMKRAINNIRLSRLDQALTDATKALELEPKNQFLMNDRGSINLALGKFENAVADYSNAIGRDGKVSEFYFNRSRAYSKLGKADLAQKDLAAAKQRGWRQDERLNIMYDIVALHNPRFGADAFAAKQEVSTTKQAEAGSATK